MRGVAVARAIDRAMPKANGVEAPCSEFQGIFEQLLPKLRLAVVFGGNKENDGSVVYRSQNTRSWKSYEAVAEDIAASLRRSGLKHVTVMPEDMQLADRLRRDGVHMAWLNTGGVQGRNSAAHAASLLEMVGIPYVGHDPLNATTLDNKHAFKREAVCAGLPTAAFTTWDMARGLFQPERNSRFKFAFGDYQGPFVVKPVSGRASLHVSVLPSREGLSEAVANVYDQTGNLVLIERYLPGREFCISVAGRMTVHDGIVGRGAEPFAFGALERLFEGDEKIFTSMDTKPITNERFKSVDPMERELWTNLHKLARDVFLEFNLTTLIRIDVRADEQGNLHILEANPKPDLKYPTAGVTSLVSAGLSQTQLGYDDLILSLLADRLDCLLRHSPAAVRHITDLLGSTVTPLQTKANAQDYISDVMVHALSQTAEAMRLAGSPTG
jgi:D-alanine-D-alanine ligase